MIGEVQETERPADWKSPKITAGIMLKTCGLPRDTNLQGTRGSKIKKGRSLEDSTSE